MKLRVTSRILVKDAWWDLEGPVLEAHLIGDKVLVLYDEASYPTPGASSNLVAYSMKRELLWIAANPTENFLDVYTHVLAESPLKVANSGGLSCRLDIATGKIKKLIFAE